MLIPDIRSCRCQELVGWLISTGWPLESRRKQVPAWPEARRRGYRASVRPARCTQARERLLPPQLGDLVIVGRGVSDQAIGQGEDPLRYPQGPRPPAAAGAEMRHLQPDRAIGFEPHVDQLRSR